MTIHIYVEGPSDRVGLLKLLHALGVTSQRIRVYPLEGTKFLPRIGRRAAAVLCEEVGAHVFACPDLAPKASYENPRWAYSDYQGLQDVLEREVRRELKGRVGARRLSEAMLRFHPHPFRHDFEVILLACPELLKRRLRTDTDITKHYNKSPEDQNFDDYPKKVVRRLFSKFATRGYNPVDDCAAVLEYLTPEHVESIERTCPRLGKFLAAIRQVFAA